MSFTLHIEKQAAKTIKTLDRTTIKRIHARMKQLAQNPHNPRISGVVEMGQGERKSRVGLWRLFFEVDEAAHTVNIIAIRPRDKAYKK